MRQDSFNSRFQPLMHLFGGNRTAVIAAIPTHSVEFCISAFSRQGISFIPDALPLRDTGKFVRDRRFIVEPTVPPDRHISYQPCIAFSELPGDYRAFPDTMVLSKN